MAERRVRMFAEFISQHEVIRRCWPDNAPLARLVVGCIKLRLGFEDFIRAHRLNWAYCTSPPLVLFVQPVRGGLHCAVVLMDLQVIIAARADSTINESSSLWLRRFELYTT
jgi:hypothetical protein